jgi:hypothetical protein
MKFPLYIALCVCVIYYSVAFAENPRLELLGDGEFAIYSREDIRSPLVDRRVASGIGFIYYTDSINAHALRNKFTHIDGESIVLPRHFSANQIFRKLGYREVSFTGTIAYGYSPRARAFIKSDGQRINLQVVERNGTTVVGWPVILGVY